MIRSLCSHTLSCEILISDAGMWRRCLFQRNLAIASLTNLATLMTTGRTATQSTPQSWRMVWWRSSERSGKTAGGDEFQAACYTYSSRVRFKPRFSAILQINIFVGGRLQLSCGRSQKVYILIAVNTVSPRSSRWICGFLRFFCG